VIYATRVTFSVHLSATEKKLCVSCKFKRYCDGCGPHQNCPLDLEKQGMPVPTGYEPLPPSSKRSARRRVLPMLDRSIVTLRVVTDEFADVQLCLGRGAARRR
jgi:hypothetical protein